MKKEQLSIQNERISNKLLKLMKLLISNERTK